jgi:hypothetical protein
VEGTLHVRRDALVYTQHIVNGIPVLPESITPLPPTDEDDPSRSQRGLDDALEGGHVVAVVAPAKEHGDGGVAAGYVHAEGRTLGPKP